MAGSEQPEPVPVIAPAVKKEARSLNCLTILEKDALCKHKQQHPGLSNTQLKAFAKSRFNKEPSSSQVSRILQEPEKWAGSEARGPTARKVRHGKWPTLEAALQIIFAEERQTAHNITAATILRKAREIAPELGINDFTGSNTWAENFRNRSTFAINSVPVLEAMTQALAAPPLAVLPPDSATVPGQPANLQIETAPEKVDPEKANPGPAIISAPGPLVLVDPTQVPVSPVAPQGVSLEEAHHAAFVVASFMEQNSDKFPTADQLTFEQRIRAKMSRFLIDKMRQEKN